MFRGSILAPRFFRQPRRAPTGLERSCLSPVKVQGKPRLAAIDAARYMVVPEFPQSRVASVKPFPRLYESTAIDDESVATVISAPRVRHMLMHDSVSWDINGLCMMLLPRANVEMSNALIVSLFDDGIEMVPMAPYLVIVLSIT